MICCGAGLRTHVNVCVFAKGSECVCVSVLLHISCMLTAVCLAQVMLMRRRGYGGDAEGHIYLVCYPSVPAAL